MSHRNDQSKKSFTAFDQASTLVAVVERAVIFGSLQESCQVSNAIR
jgi:hypothetical protein